MFGLSWFQSNRESIPSSHELVQGRLPAGERIYAIGDIHGRYDLLARLLDQIDVHRAQNPIASAKIILLGDLVDRGPQSYQTLDLILERAATGDLIALAGNHEEFMLKALNDASAMLDWLKFGGRETLFSYDVTVPVKATRADIARAMRQIMDVVPPSHIALLRNLPTSFVAGTYAFVHAGVKPGVALANQRREDLLWIRDEFLMYTGAHEYLIVHGHTPVENAVILPNRINIDTGAYISGNLTCLTLEADRQYFI